RRARRLIETNRSERRQKGGEGGAGRQKEGGINLFFLGEGTGINLPRRKFLHLTAGAAALQAVPRIARAQAYPTRPVRIVVGVAAGSSPDLFARRIGQWLSG